MKLWRKSTNNKPVTVSIKHHNMVSRLCWISLSFYGAMLLASFIHLDEKVIDALESAGTLSLGAFIGILQESNKNDND